MGLYEQAKAKERLKIATADTSDNTLLDNLGAEADREVYGRILRQAKRYGKAHALPALDITNALLGGDPVPQTVKDACTNLVVSMYHGVHDDPALADFWQKASDRCIATFIEELEVDAEAWCTIIDSDENKPTGVYTLSGRL